MARKRKAKSRPPFTIRVTPEQGDWINSTSAATGLTANALIQLALVAMLTHLQAKDAEGKVIGQYLNDHRDRTNARAAAAAIKAPKLRPIPLTKGAA